ncbi:MAG TPA: PorP/SprF family type IX secretion system membrane protein [Cytophagaceae bacterium]|jgi:type IX secretion system PorP/SprF family membrane protein|nr:PorP/SprF family type IX secretion system membrane protein [Cytophagaceae bacterium]
MKSKRPFLFVVLLNFVSTMGFAQTQLAVTNFQNAIQLFNPAYVGTEDHINVSMINKTQWLNTTAGTPSLQGISGHIPFNYQRIGAGLNVLQETTATVQSFYFNGNASYKINFKQGRLSFGIRVGFLQRNENLGGLLVKDPNDVLITNNRQFVPEFGGGFFFKQRNFYTGLSFVRSAGIYLETNSALKNYYHFIVGGSRILSSRLTILPACHIEYTNDFNPYATVIIPVKFDDLFSIGLGYGTASVLSFVATLNIDKALRTTANRYVLSYAYDQSFNKRINYIGNTHELILSVKLVRAEKIDKILKRKITVSPLFFD